MSDIRSLALSRAYELVEAGKSDEARTVLEPILLNAPDNIDAWWIYAHAVDDPKDARRALENVLRIDPHYAGAVELLGTLNDEYPQTAEVSVVPEPFLEHTESEPEPDYELDEPFPEQQRSYEPARVATAKEPSRSWLPVAIVAGIIVLLFVVLVLILPSLSGTIPPTSTVASVAGNTTPQATTPLLIAETEQMTEEPVATIEVITSTEDAAAPTTEAMNTPVEDNTETALLPTENEAVETEIAPSDTQAPTEQQVTLDITPQALPTDEPEPEASVEASVVPAMTRTNLSEVAEATVEPTAMAESAETTDLADVEYSEYLTEALQTFALASPAIEDVQTSYGNTVLARVCTNEGLELRETLRSAMEILAHESDVVPESFTAIGVRLINCADDSTLRIISVDRESVSAYVSGAADEGEFEAQWRAQ